MMGYLLPRQYSQRGDPFLANVCLLGKSSSKVEDDGYRSEPSYSADEFVHMLVVEVFAPC